MHLYVYSEVKPARVAARLWKDGLRNLLESQEPADATHEVDIVATLDALAAQRNAAPGAKFVLSDPVRRGKRLANFMPVAQTAVGPPWQDALAIADDTPVPHLPNLAAFAVRGKPRLLDRFRAQESKAKRRRIAVLLTPLQSMLPSKALERYRGYHDFFKWELADYLDEASSYANTHLLSPADNEDAAFDVQDVVLRMRKHEQASAHSFGKVDELLSLVANAHGFITDDRTYAFMARGVGVHTILLSDRPARDDSDAALFGPGYIEPYTASRDTLQHRFALLENWPHESELLDTARAAATAALTGPDHLFVS
jgi:hypothetical protein